MSTKEVDTLIRTQDAEGNQRTHYPVTLGDNVLVSDELAAKLALAADADPTVNAALAALLEALNSSSSDEVSGAIATHNDDAGAHPDLAPTFTEATTLEKLTSGEKLKVLLGKIAKAVSDFIGHLADGVKHITADERTAWNGKAAGNHTHTAAAVGAAAASHNHSAGNITSGTIAAARLPTTTIDKGGTGQTTAPLALYALVNGSTALASTGLATGDFVGIGDVSAATGKKVTLANLATFLSTQAGAKVVFGSYVGTNVYGEANPNSLTFTFAPKIVLLVAALYAGSSSYVEYAVFSGYSDATPVPPIISETLSTTPTKGRGFSPSGDDGTSYAYKSSDGKTVYWYNTDGTTAQCNNNNRTYYYIAIG